MSMRLKHGTATSLDWNNMSDNTTKLPLMVFDEEARGKLVEGVELAYRAVCSTLSPKGRNVAIARQWGAPYVVHDGVTVSKEVVHPDHFVQMGINMVKEAAHRTNEEAGDGTTQSTLLAYEIISRGMKLIQEGKNPMVLRREVQEAKDQAVKGLEKIAKPSSSQEDLMRVATISSSDEEIGRVVSEAVFKVGKDGLVTVEGGGYEMTSQYTEGMTLDKGMSAPHFVTNTSTMEAVIVEPVIVLIDRKVTTVKEIVPLLEKVIEISKDIVLIGDIQGDALSTVIANKMQGNINAVVVAPPAFAQMRKNYLEDIGILTGAKVFSSELSMDVEAFAESFDESWLGRAERVVSGRKATIIVGGKGNPEAIKAQVEKLRSLKDASLDVYEKERNEERLAKLTTGVAVIRVGARTEIEARERLERVKDAVGAAKSALAEGTVPGSGSTYLKLIKSIDPSTDGGRLMREVMETTIRKVMLNSGETEETINALVEELKRSRLPDYGYDVTSGKKKRMYAVGVIDPAKVIRLSLENSVSVATSIMTTNTLIDPIKREEV